VDDLRNYTFLNYIGVLKITKKYDKKTSSSLKPEIVPILIRQSFYTSSVLAGIFTESQIYVSQIMWYARKTRPAAKDYKCQIWYRLPLHLTISSLLVRLLTSQKNCFAAKNFLMIQSFCRVHTGFARAASSRHRTHHQAARHVTRNLTS